jgi:hypothetical protein
MNGKFVVYALLVSLVCTAMSWTSLFSDDRGSGGSFRSSSGSTWRSNSGGSWGGGGHK